MFSNFAIRKTIHILVAIGVIILSNFLNRYEMAFLCLTFVFLNAIINYKDFGIITFPLSVLISTLIYYEDKNTYFLVLFPMFFADPLSSIIGKNLNKLKFGEKTIIGSLVFFTITFISSVHFSKNILFSIVFSIFLTFVEIISKKGLDNFFVVILGLVLINVKIELFLSAMVFALIIASISLILNWLDAEGSIGTFVIGSVILYSGGFKWAIPLALFLILGSIVSKLNDKKIRRNLLQVLSNGGVSFILSIINIFHPNDLLYFVHICSISAMCSDTFSSEIGMKFSKKAYLITNFKEVEKGTTGGVSFVGFLGGVLGSFLISIFYTKWIYAFLIGIIGNLIDSIIGALIERKGLISNNLTNFIASLISSIIGALTYTLKI
ncbi:MAG: DUF92 domain-containing protein [candidate division WOR-3 bacterium]